MMTFEKIRIAERSCCCLPRSSGSSEREGAASASETVSGRGIRSLPTVAQATSSANTRRARRRTYMRSLSGVSKPNQGSMPPSRNLGYQRTEEQCSSHDGHRHQEEVQDRHPQHHIEG